MPVRFTTENDDAAGRGDKQRRSARSTWNTIKPSPKRGRPYATSLTLAFALTAVMTCAVYLFVCLKAWAGAFGVGSVTQYIGAITALAKGISGLMFEVGAIQNNAEFLKTSFDSSYSNEQYADCLRSA